MNYNSDFSTHIFNEKTIVRIIEKWRREKNRIVFTNGCFDILHLGHVDYLYKASKLADKLIVGLNSDSSVKRIKEKNRPVQGEKSRSSVLAALKFVDAVVIFNEETPQQLIEIVQPHILVKGADYKINNIVGSDFVISNGGNVETIDFMPGYSTSDIINKIKNG